MQDDALSRYLSDEQKQIFQKVLSVVDNRPIGANEDFVAFSGKIEPTKSFFQKAAYLAGVSFSASTPQIVPTADDTLITVSVSARVGEREVTVSGASSIKETGVKNPRALHDAVARAQTRAFKIAVENLLGYAFVNQIIIRLFGGFDALHVTPKNVTHVLHVTSSDKKNNVTEDKHVTELKKKLWDKMKNLNEKGVLQDEKMRSIIDFVKQKNDAETIEMMLRRLEKEEQGGNH